MTPIRRPLTLRLLQSAAPQLLNEAEEAPQWAITVTEALAATAWAGIVTVPLSELLRRVEADDEMKLALESAVRCGQDTTAVAMMLAEVFNG